MSREQDAHLSLSVLVSRLAILLSPLRSTDSFNRLSLQRERRFIFHLFVTLLYSFCVFCYLSIVFLIIPSFCTRLFLSSLCQRKTSVGSARAILRVSSSFDKTFFFFYRDCLSQHQRPRESPRIEERASFNYCALA